MWPAASGLKSENCWCEPDSNYFRVRGLNYLRDRKKVSAGEPFADLIATDWLVDYQRIDNVCSRPTGRDVHSPHSVHWSIHWSTHWSISPFIGPLFVKPHAFQAHRSNELNLRHHTKLFFGRVNQLYTSYLTQSSASSKPGRCNV